MEHIDTVRELMADPVGWVVILPVLAAVACLAVPAAWEKARAALAVLASAVTLVLGIMVFRGPRGSVVPDGLDWLALRIDGLSSFVLLAVTGFGFLVALYSYGYMQGRDRQREYYAYFLLTLAASCAAVLTNHLYMLLGLWGFLGMTLYLLIGIGGTDATDAAKKTFIVVGGSDCLLLLGVALVVWLTGKVQMSAVSLSFIDKTGQSVETVYLAFLCFVAAAFAKAGALPLHTWVPDCGEKAPVSVTAFLPASLDKLLGIYLLARTAMAVSTSSRGAGMFELATSPGMQTLLMGLGAATVLLAVMMALVQHDMKRLLSYHAVSQVGYMVLGIATCTPVGIAGGLFHMLNHAAYKACLFLSAGSVEKRAGTTDLDRLGGLGRLMPVTFGCCFVAAMAISGVPPLNGFASKWMVYQGIIQTGNTQAGHGTLWIVWLAAAMLGSALTLASFVKVLHSVFLCKPSPELTGRDIRESGPSMYVPMLVLAAVCVLFGVAVDAIPLEQYIKPAVAGLPSMKEFPGIWDAGPVAIALVITFGVGLVVYLFTTASKPRESATYVGGELLEETYIEGAPQGADRTIEVTGVDFYRTVEELTPEVKSLYRAALDRIFDTYDIGRRVAFYHTDLLRAAHTGRLPTYLTWVLVGLLALIAYLRKMT